MDDFVSQTELLDEAKEDFLVYAEEVLTDRAIPSIEDGLLSAHRKLLWTMESVLKMNNKSKTKKCASIVGTTLATSYTHGDAACYGALCKMSLGYLMRYPLVTGQGSLGTQENNDVKASQRYTEAKPSEFADLMMKDFNKNVVPLKRTYNDEYMEPVMLPSAFPNAIVNGKESIGVAIAHSSLPHNLTEVCNGLIAYLHNENLTIDELLQYIKGPDLPLGGTVINAQDIREAYATGKSKVSLKVRGDYEIKGNTITFTTIPYRTYRNKIKEQISTNIEELDKIFDDFNDESYLGKNKLVFTVKKGVDPQLAVNKLFALTDLQTSLSVNMNYIVNGTPKLCSMLDMVKYYIEHQHNMIINAAKYDKAKAEERLHIVRGLLKAVDKIDEVIALIRASKNKAEATPGLMKLLDVDEIQAKAILSIQLGSLTRIDKEALVQEEQNLVNKIKECIDLIEKKEVRVVKLIENITSLKNKYGDERRTKLLSLNVEEEEKKAIVKEDVVITLTSDGKICRANTSAYNVSKRGKKGTKTKDMVLGATTTTTTDMLMLFTSSGKMFKIAVADIPEEMTYLGNLITFETSDKILNIAAMESDVKYMCFVTKNGLIKKTIMDEYLSLSKRKNGVVAIKLKEGDTIINVFGVNDKEEIIAVSKGGMAIRIRSDDVSSSGRATMGSKIMTFNEGDTLLMADKITADTTFLATVSANGVGRKNLISDYECQSKGGKGVIVVKDHLPLAGAALINDNDSLLLFGKGKILATVTARIAATDIPKVQRTNKGDILMKNQVEYIVKI